MHPVQAILTAVGEAFFDAVSETVLQIVRMFFLTPYIVLGTMHGKADAFSLCKFPFLLIE